MVHDSIIEGIEDVGTVGILVEIRAKPKGKAAAGKSAEHTDKPKRKGLDHNRKCAFNGLCQTFPKYARKKLLMKNIPKDCEVGMLPKEAIVPLEKYVFNGLKAMELPMEYAVVHRRVHRCCPFSRTPHRPLLI